MELRWYWRVLRRQVRVIAITTAIVAVLSLLFTVYTYYSEHYKAAATIQFAQDQPHYNTQNLTVDPLGAADGNASTAAGDAKLYTEGDAFFKGVSSYLNSKYGIKIDYRSATVGVTQVGSRQLRIDYSSPSDTRAREFVDAGVYVIEHSFLPDYLLQFQQGNLAAGGFKANVYEPPITVSFFDPINARPLSLSSTALSWLVKVVLGFVLGLGLAFLWEYLDASIHDEQDVRNWIGAPTLGVIPAVRRVA